MKKLKLFFIVILILPFITKASILENIFTSKHVQSLCESTVTTTNNRFWRIRKPALAFENNVLYFTKYEGGNYNIYSLAESSAPVFLYSSSLKIVDIEVSEEVLWVAHENFLSNLNLKTKAFNAKIKTHEFEQPLFSKEIIHDIVITNNKVFVAHGTLGVSAIDKKTLSFLWRESYNVNQVNGHRSKVVSIVYDIHSNALFAALQGLTLNTGKSAAFSGIIKISTFSPQKWNEFPYHARKSGILADAHLTLENEILYINNSGILHVIATDQMLKSQAIVPKWEPAYYNDNGIRRIASWKGDLLLSNDTVFACAHFMQSGTRATRHGVPVIQQL